MNIEPKRAKIIEVGSFKLVSIFNKENKLIFEKVKEEANSNTEALKYTLMELEDIKINTEDKNR